MLARNFKTADELFLTAGMYEALINVLDILERGEVAPAPDVEWHFSLPPGYGRPWRGKTVDFFRMAEVAATSECGTACCLLGLAMWVSQSIYFPDMPRSLRELFYCVKAADVTDPALGASALRNYLVLGEPRWDEVLDQS